MLVVLSSVYRSRKRTSVLGCSLELTVVFVPFYLNVDNKSTTQAEILPESESKGKLLVERMTVDNLTCREAYRVMSMCGDVEPG